MGRTLSRRLVRRFGDDTGSNMVEAALLTPLLLLLTFGIVDFAMLFTTYLALENGVSQASRYAVTGNLVPGLSREASIMQAMRDATPTLTIADQAFTFSHMTVGGSTWIGGSGGPGEIAKVRVDYTFKFLTPLMRPFFTNGQIGLAVESAMKNERRFE
jgi:TadE-like protein